MASTISAGTTAGTAIAIAGDTTGNLAFQTNGTTTAMTIDTSQNVGIGSTTPSSTGVDTGSTKLFAVTPNSSFGAAITAIADSVGRTIRVANQGKNVIGVVDATDSQINYGSNSVHPVIFLSGGTERMRITSGGDFLVAKTSASTPTVGFEARANGVLSNTVNGITGVFINRLTNDGSLIDFQQDNVAEGSISVSGTTVSYNGGHLARWSQLPNNQKDDTLLKGTVMSNLDDMCVWVKDGEELPNEQLNKMKVSDVEGDTNVAGVFVNWTFDEQCQSDDMNIAMTGDMIIRIAEGVVVQRGDLLMSTGDGTAKPQGDDIVRSKTIAKVTSNHVTCTYADGSYCVPCVLMAC